MNQRCILQRWYTYKSEYLREFETEFENILGCESGAHMGLIIEKKTRGRQSRATVPLSRLECDRPEMLKISFLFIHSSTPIKSIHYFCDWGRRYSQVRFPAIQYINFRRYLFCPKKICNISRKTAALSLGFYSLYDWLFSESC